METPTRRRLLQTAVVVPSASLAGCTGPFGRSPTATATPEYERLPHITVYTAEDVGIRLPERVKRVTAATSADLVVLHANPETDAEQAVTWLVDECAVALLGDRAQETWLDWTESDAYHDAFRSEGRAVADPAPHLLVAAAADPEVTTHRYSWGDQPSNGEVVRALDDAMAEIAEERDT